MKSSLVHLYGHLHRFCLKGFKQEAIWFVLVSSITLSCVPCIAQFSSNIEGTITDPSGAVLPGAKVTLRNTQTNVAVVFTTNPAGHYAFNSLAPGSYEVKVEASGFETSLRAIGLSTSQSQAVDMQMQIGAASSMVTVTAENSHDLDPNETRIQYTLSADEIANMPLAGRSTITLLRNAPGATGIDNGEQNVSINRSQAAESVNGRGNSSNLFLLDYIPINSESYNNGNGQIVSSGWTVLMPHPDMLAEVALETTTFSAENTSGSGIETNFTTKSGTNKFHGDSDYTYAGGPFVANTNGVTSNHFRQQYVSLALGGPLWKDRTFFFGSYFNQGDVHTGGGQSGFYAPEFISWAAAQYPNSQDVVKGLVPFPADRGIGQIDVQTTGASVIGTSCGTAGMPPCDLPIWDTQFSGANSTNNGEQYNFRIDHSLRHGSDRIYASYFAFDQSSFSPRIQSTMDAETPSRGTYLAGNYTHTFSQSLLNQASFGLTRFDFNYTPTAHSQGILEVPYIYGCTGCGGLNVTQFLEQLLEHQAYGRDNLTWVKGNHNFTFGFQGSYNNELQDNSAIYGRPFLGFSFDLPDFLNDTWNLELIYTLSANLNNNPGKFIPQRFGAEMVRYGVYAEDSWKATRNLMLTYGIRWDDLGNPGLWGKNAEQFANIKLGSGTTLQQQVAGLSVGVVNNVFSGSRIANFLPRAGFAYTLPYGGRNTVLKGGFGVYDDDINLYDVTSAIPTQPPVRLSLTLGSWTNPQPLASFGNSTVQGAPGGNPYGFQFPTISIFGYAKDGAPVDANGNVQIGDLYGVDPNLKAPRSFIYNFGVEQALPAHLVVSALYSGDYANNQLILTDANTYAGLFSGLADSTQAGARYQPDFGKIKFFRNGGIANYNGLILTAQQTAKNLTYQASFVLGKALGDPTTNWTDQQNIHSQYTYSNGDVRRRLTISETYAVPRFFSKRLLNEALAGWNLSNSLVTQSGTPFTVTSTSGSYDFNEDGIYYDIPGYTGKKRSFTNGDLRKSYFSGGTIGIFGPVANNGSSFVAPPVNSEGDRQNNFRGPGYFDLDTGIGKKFNFPFLFKEGASLDLRGEFLNIFNHANYGGFGTSYDSINAIGVVTNQLSGRVDQLGARFEF